MARQKLGLSGRPAPASKHAKSRSSLGSTSSPGVSSPSIAQAQVTKAAKRAAKRAALLQSTSESSALAASDASAATTAAKLSNLKGGAAHLALLPTISKSSLRRRKRKAKREAEEADIQDGMDEIRDVMREEVEEGGAAEEDDGMEGEADGGYAANKRGPKGGKVSAKKRKNVLAQEMARQPHILSNPTFGSSPFEALRTHARNSMQ